ncbi:hypothetical protein PLESTB_001400000 [Pleodorina starrii]|uniref:Uncharacterized protein n=1 Tax=Pleodorina starrii TaxID=330485 RepID=A0A9W6BWE7_9CHLO|nr:hypothetical protein PLESTB_001400000 [Pleodorina starrii]
MQPAQAVSQDEKLSDFSDDYWRGSSSSNCSEASEGVEPAGFRRRRRGGGPAQRRQRRKRRKRSRAWGGAHGRRTAPPQCAWSCCGGGNNNTQWPRREGGKAVGGGPGNHATASIGGGHAVDLQHTRPLSSFALTEATEAGDPVRAAVMRNIQQRVLQIHTAQQAAAAAAANTAAAAAVKAQKHEAGPEAALGPVGAVEAGGGGGAQGRGR